MISSFVQSPIWPTLEDVDKIELPNLSRATVGGISVAIVGNVLISLALNCQKLAHRRLERDREEELEGSSKDSGGPTELPSDDDNNDLDVFSTPTRHVGRSSRQFDSGYDTLRPRSSSVAFVETQPLIQPSEATLSANYGSNTQGHVNASPKPSVIPQLWRTRAVNAASTADRGHIGATHAMLPVDVITIPQEGNVDSLAKSSIKDHERYSGNESDYLKSKLWWSGFLLMNIGEIGNFISYAFAPASVVAPLGTVALIANCLFAPLMLGERFRKRDFFGVIIAILGAVTVVLSANPSDARLDPHGLIAAISQTPFVVYSIVYMVGVILLSGLSESSLGRRTVYVDVGLCALFGKYSGFTVLSTKAISTLLTMEWLEIFTERITYPVIAVLLGTGVGQIRYLNRALMRFDSKIVVPTQFVLFNLSAIVGSAILYGDFRRTTFHQMVTFLYGCGATFAGVFILTSDSTSSDEEKGKTEEEENDEDNDPDDLGALPPPHDAPIGSLARRNRATLVIPDSASSISSTPTLQRRASLVNMLGFSPAQRLLIVHTPPRDDFMRPLVDIERDSDTSPHHIPESISRRRAIAGITAVQGNQKLFNRKTYCRA
ncbi:Magnesium transporter NIPA [Abortiporus biennis]